MKPTTPGIWLVLISLSFMVSLQLQAQECPCDSARLYFRYSFLLIDNPPGFADLSNDLSSAGFPSLPERGLTLYREGEGISSILSGMEVGVAVPSLAGEFALWWSFNSVGAYRASSDSLSDGGRGSRADYSTLGFVGGFPLWSLGPIEVMPVLGAGFDVVDLSLSESEGELGAFGLENSMKAEHFGVMLVGGVQASVVIPIISPALELTVRPAFAVSVMESWRSAFLSDDDLAAPESTRFLLHIGVGLSSESYTCGIPRR